MQARVLYRDVLDVFCTYCSVWKASLYYNFFTWPDFQHFLQQSLQWCRPCLAGHRVEPSISWIISYVTCEALNETWTPHQVFCVCFVRCELTLVTFPVMFSNCDSPPPPFFFSWCHSGHWQSGLKRKGRAEKTLLDQKLSVSEGGGAWTHPWEERFY